MYIVYFSLTFRSSTLLADDSALASLGATKCNKNPSAVSAYYLLFYCVRCSQRNVNSSDSAFQSSRPAFLTLFGFGYCTSVGLSDSRGPCTGVLTIHWRLHYSRTKCRATICADCS